ncbi:hypothetical protein Bca52824_020940 [Brassica carinata]|uniref:Transcription factor MYC/MYB N-terminal domain-containing protein n=1 Tax=Brassica carinata TaxID=52824 RepID=A0A8X7VVY2_BRACI|nr:hypothetical protein Bca52824_020940 [Brassica carinata]
MSSSSSPTVVSSRAMILLSLLKTNPFRKLTTEDVNANPPPFSVFCGGTELYSFPASQWDATERVQENVRHFIGNYISVFVVLFLVSLYKQPIPFLTLLASFPVKDYLDHLITKRGLDQAYPFIRRLLFFTSKLVLTILLMRVEVVIAFFLSLLAAYLDGGLGTSPSSKPSAAAETNEKRSFRDGGSTRGPKNRCLNTEWTYSVFWMLMWEDGYCIGRGGSGDFYGEMEGEDLVRKSFSKMSIQLYNYGEGLMGKVASDKCHKWVFKEQNESESNASSYWQSSFDAIPTEWKDQFKSGIQTIAVVQAGHGLLQLGSCKIVSIFIKLKFIRYQSGFSKLFSSNSNTSSSNTSPMGPNHPILPPQTQPLQPSLPLYNWNGTSQRTMMVQSSLPTYQPHMPFPVMPHSNKEQDSDVKWPTGLSFFNAFTNNVNAKLLFDSEGSGDKPEHHSQ